MKTTVSALARGVFAGLALSALLGSVAFAHGFEIGELEIAHPYIPTPRANAQSAAGYFSVVNKGTEADRLIGVESDVAKKVELHESKTDAAGVTSMAPVAGVDIAPGESVTLAPGGLHVMFMGLNGALVEGEKVAGKLVFEKAGEVAVEFAIDPPNDSAADAHDGH